MPTIKLPGGELLKFPEGMTDEAMAKAIADNYPQYAPKTASADAAPAAVPAAAPSKATGIVGLIGDAAQAVGDFVGGIPDAIRNMPIVAPDDGSAPASVMERAAAEQKRTGKTDNQMDPPPDGITPFTWARAKGMERAAPLDPRLAAIAPADELARAEQLASKRANAANGSYARIMARAREDNKRDAAEAKRQAEMYSFDNLAGNTGKNLQNFAASSLKIGPTVIKGVADIGRMMTGDTVGVDTSKYMAEGMKAIDETIAHASLTEQNKEFGALMADPNADVGDLFAYMADNPELVVDQGVTTIGSMFLPVAAAGGAAKVGQLAGLSTNAVRATVGATTLGTVAAQNAADTFTSDELKDASLSDRYQAATVSAGISLLAGMATKGGAEGEIARRLTGELTESLTGTPSARKAALKATAKFLKEAGKEGIQEATEEFGNALGEQVGTGRVMFDTNNLSKRMAFAATLGAAMGAGSHLAVSAKPAAPDDGSAAAEQARRDALNRWNTDGLTGSRARTDGRREPTWQEAAGGAPAAPARPEPTLETIAEASNVDDAIRAAQAVADAPVSRAPAAPSPHATAAEIDALEDAAYAVPAYSEAGQAGAADVANAQPGAPIAPAQSGLPGAVPAMDGAAGPAPLIDAAGKPAAETAPANLPAAPEAAPAAAAAGKETDDPADWHEFPKETGTLGVPRSQMPQIRAEHRGALVNFLNARGISHEQVEVDADTLKPSQREFSLSKVQKAIDYVGGNRSILVSSDGHVVDGHHQWLAAAEQGEPIKAIRLNAPIKQLLRTVSEFPSAGVDTSSAPASNPGITPALQNNAGAGTRLEAGRQKHERQDELVRQAAAALEKRKTTGGQRARDRLKTENPFLGFLASHGVQMDDRSDTGGQGGRAGGVMVPGYGPLYRRSGKRLDELAALAQEAGFLTQQDIDDATDTGGTRKLADMIQRAVHGKEVIQPAGLLDAVAPTADQRLLGEAQRLGIETEGKTADQLYEAVVEAHYQEEQRRQRNGATNVDEQDDIDRAADQFTDREAQLVADAMRDADIPLDGGTPSDNLTDEEIDAIFGIQSSGNAAGARADRGETEGAPAEAAREGDARAGQPGDVEPLLSGYTGAEILERERQADERAKAEKAEADRLERQRKADQLAREKQGRIAGTVDDFQLGQTAEEALAGQRSIFDAPPAAAADPTPDAAKQSEAETEFEQLLANKAMAPYRELGDAGKASYKAGFVAGFEGQPFPAAAVKDGAMDDGYQLGKRQAREKDAVVVQGEDGRAVIDYSRLTFKHVTDFDVNPTLAAKVQEALRTRPDAYTVGQYRENDTRITLPQVDGTRGNNGGQFQVRDDGRMDLLGDYGFGWASTMSQKSVNDTLNTWLKNMGPAPEAKAAEDTAPTALQQEIARAKKGKHPYDAERARPLLLIPCSEGKLEGTHKAVDLYKGSMLEVYRKWKPTENRPDVYILSAKHGIVHGETLIESYEQPMTKERLAELLAKPVDLSMFAGKNFSEVYIAGSAQYRQLGRNYVEQLRKAGFVGPDATVDAAPDGAGIGDQRGHFASYLRKVDMRGPANAAELADELDAEQTALEKEIARVKGAKLDNATAPEHIAGVDDRELGEIVAEFNAAQAEMMQDGQAITNIFTSPKKSEVVRLKQKAFATGVLWNEKEATAYRKDVEELEKLDKKNAQLAKKGKPLLPIPAGLRERIAEFEVDYLPHAAKLKKAADIEVQKWIDHAQNQGENAAQRRENSKKVVLSFFDLSGEWSRPWEEAGYEVHRFDIQADPEMGDVNNFSTDFFGDWFGDFDGKEVYAILAACPCTDFASSGSKHFAAKDEDGRTVASVKLVHQTLRAIEYFKPSIWSLENPVGRIEKLGGLPPWRLSFDPYHLGDTYTKATMIWGRFNADLPVAPVEPIEGSKMWKLYGGKSMATKNARSETPQGFSYGFFMANNAIDHPAMALHGKFDRLDRKLIEKALELGIKPDDIETAVEDFYYMDLDDDAANDAIRELIAEARDETDPATPTTPAPAGQVDPPPAEFYKQLSFDYVGVASTEPVTMPADEALAKTRTDIKQLEAMLNCMGD